jgi:hypothetical protein
VSNLARLRVYFWPVAALFISANFRVGNIPKVSNVRSKHGKTALNRLGRKPDVLNSKLRAALCSNERCRKRAKNDGSFSSDAKQGFSTHSAEHGQRPLLLKVTSHQFNAANNLG